MKRFAAAVLAAGLSAVIFAGCGTGQSTGTQTMQKPSKAPQAEQTTSTTTEAESTTGSSLSSEAEANTGSPLSSEAEANTGSPLSSETEGTISNEALEMIQLKQEKEWEAPITGLTFEVPENIKDIKGQLHLVDRGEDRYGDNIFVAYFSYNPRTDEELIAFYDERDSITDEAVSAKHDYDFLIMLQRDISTVVAIKEDMDPGKVSQLSEGTVTELGSAGGYDYYYVVPDFDSISLNLEGNVPDEMYAEFKMLAEQAPEFASGITVQGPDRPLPKAKVGTQISFEATDLDGNTVKSEDLFKDHKVTMIYIWETFSDTCKEELPRLEEMSKTLAEKDCQVIGICADAVKGEEVISEAKKILSENGVTYTNIVATNDLLSMLLVEYPTTYLVDSTGTVMTGPIGGAYFDQYDEKLAETVAAVDD